MIFFISINRGVDSLIFTDKLSDQWVHRNIPYIEIKNFSFGHSPDKKDKSNCIQVFCNGEKHLLIKKFQIFLYSIFHDIKIEFDEIITIDTLTRNSHFLKQLYLLEHHENKNNSPQFSSTIKLNNLLKESADFLLPWLKKDNNIDLIDLLNKSTLVKTIASNHAKFATLFEIISLSDLLNNINTNDSNELLSTSIIDAVITHIKNVENLNNFTKEQLLDALKTLQENLVVVDITPSSQSIFSIPPHRKQNREAPTKYNNNLGYGNK